MAPATHWYRIGAYVTALTVIAVSSWPRLAFNPLHISYVDKAEHLAVYAVLAYFVFQGWVAPKIRVGSIRPLWIVLLLVAAFAAVDEYHQRWIPGRVTEWADLLADLLGVVTGFALGAFQEALRSARRQKSHSA